MNTPEKNKDQSDKKEEIPQENLSEKENSQQKSEKKDNIPFNLF